MPGGFKDCDAFKALDEKIKGYILSKKDMHLKEGFSEIEAEKRAITDFKNETVETLVDLHSQIGNKVFEKVAEPIKAETPPPEPPKVEVQPTYVERPSTELSFRGLQDVSNEFGYEDVKSRDRVSDIRERFNAEQTTNEWAAKGEYKKNIEELLTKINNKELVPTAKQRLILQQHLANESAKLRDIKDKNSTEFDNQLKVVKRIKDIGLIARQEAGAALRIGENMGSQPHPVEDFADAFAAKLEANGVDVLTEKQKAEVAENVKMYEERTKVAEDKVTELETKMAEIEAAKELSKTVSKKKPIESIQKKTANDYKAEREAFKKELIEAKKEHEQWLKDKGIQQAGISGLVLTPKMVKAVGKIIGSHVDEIGNNLAEVTKRVFDEMKDIFAGITERDIHDIIAGEYAQRLPPRSQLVKDLTDLRSEAALLNKIEDVESGVPKTESQKKEKNRRQKELQDQLNKLKKEKGYDDETNLKELKRKNEEQTEKIQERIKNKDFSDKEQPLSIFDNKELQRKYPQLYKETLNAIKEREDAKHEFDIQLLKDQNSKRGLGAKATDILSKTAGTVKAIVTGIDDSAVAIQTYVASLVRPIIGGKAIGLHFSHAVSQKRFDRWLTELHNSSWWDLIQKSKLSVTEPTSLKAAEKEEIFSNRFSGTIKIKGKEYKLIDAPLKPFERAFTSLGNATRVLAFKQIASKYMKEGKTFENDPELFKSLATRLNTETGRGKENEYIERASKIVTIGIWSPKLMASKFNILGISDLASLALSKVGTEGYYRKLHPRERIEAIKDVAQFVTTVTALSYLAAYIFGGKVDDEPTSSTYMDVILDSGKSFNLTGGFSGYMRVIVQTALGVKQKEGKEKKVGRLEIVGRFFRGKTPPITSAILNTAAEKDFMGKPTSVLGETKNVLLPISVKGIIEQIKRDGASSLLTQGLPTFFGFNIKDERDFQKRSKVSSKIPKPPQVKVPKPPHP